MLIKHFLSLLAGALISFNILAQELNTEGLIISPLEAEWPSPEALSFLDNELDKYNFFCANEYHRSAMALEQKKAFVTYLKENKGLDKLVIEFTYAYGYWVNKYLETGDTTLLRTVTNKAWSFDKFKKNLPISHDSYSFFKWLYAFNQQYEQGVRVYAIDLDEMNHATLELWSIKQFLLKDSLFEHFNISFPFLLKLVNSPKPNISKVENWKLMFTSELLTNESKVVEGLGAEYKEFNKILIGIDDVIERSNIKGNQISKQREKVLIRNFKREIEPTDIIYAQFGAGHLFLHKSYIYEYTGYEFLMTAIEADLIYKGRALNIFIHCAECSLGTSRTAYKPYRLKENGGATSHAPIDGLEDRDFHLRIDSLLNNESSSIDLRESKDELLQLSKLYQFLVVVF